MRMPFNAIGSLTNVIDLHSILLLKLERHLNSKTSQSHKDRDPRKEMCMYVCMYVCIRVSLTLALQGKNELRLSKVSLHLHASGLTYLVELI